MQYFDDTLYFPVLVPKPIIAQLPELIKKENKSIFS